VKFFLAGLEGVLDRPEARPDSGAFDGDCRWKRRQNAVEAVAESSGSDDRMQWILRSIAV
jgi:hypothetical protein